MAIIRRQQCVRSWSSFFSSRWLESALILILVATLAETIVHVVHYAPQHVHVEQRQRKRDRTTTTSSPSSMIRGAHGDVTQRPTRVTIVQVDTRPWVSNSSVSFALRWNQIACKHKGWEHLLFNVSSLCTQVSAREKNLHKNQVCAGGFSSPWLRVDVLLHLLRSRPADPSHLYVYCDTDVTLGFRVRLSNNASMWAHDIFLAKRVDGYWYSNCQDLKYDPCLNTGYVAMLHTPAALAFLRDWSRTRLQRFRTPWERSEQGHGGSSKNTLWHWPWEQDRLSYFLTTHRNCKWCSKVGFMTLHDGPSSYCGDMVNTSTKEYIHAPLEHVAHFLDDSHSFKECMEVAAADQHVVVPHLQLSTRVPAVPFNKSLLDVWRSQSGAYLTKAARPRFPFLRAASR